MVIADEGREEREGGRGKAGEEKARKKPNPARDSAWVGEGVGLSAGTNDHQSQRAKRQSVGVGWGGQCIE